MGASQSSHDPESKNSTQANAGAMKQDFYTLLGVERNAEPDEIKKAYRKKALELHPDKNVNNVEAATALFSEVQSAYEVLSDPQERAWYDSHREQILRDDGDNDDENLAAARAENVTITTAELLKNFSLFSSRMDMQDSNPKGFYATASKIFDMIARDEESAASRAEQDCPFYPSFGNSTSDYQDDVRPFYTAWTGFSTMKSFAWEDQYRYRDAPDRRVKRLMEKENRKLREAAIREFNDTVKQFVLYIRKRDPRYLPNFQSEEERVAAAREASKDQSRRARMENAAKLANYQEAEWSKTKDNWKGHETDEDDGDEEEPAVEFECVACNKTFKTEKQMEMHEKSKKHIKMVQTIKRQMRKDGVEFGLEEELSTPRAEESPKESDEEEEMVDDVSKVADKTEVGSEDESDEALVKNVDNLHIPEKETRETQEKQEKQDSDDVDDNDASDNDAKEAPQKTKGAKKARRKAKQTKAQEEEPSITCGVCNESFDSRTKLFQHIRNENHAAPVQAKKKNKR
ncbi:hypothetical protein ABW20_dc0101047 [Dactylellina cionopaga]|nr:hypothetical protein ABW20_dc0101047 [Dactylellina cionopaga]